MKLMIDHIPLEGDSRHWNFLFRYPLGINASYTFNFIMVRHYLTRKKRLSIQIEVCKGGQRGDTINLKALSEWAAQGLHLSFKSSPSVHLLLALSVLQIPDNVSKLIVLLRNQKLKGDSWSGLITKIIPVFSLLVTRFGIRRSCSVKNWICIFLQTNQS